MLEFVDTFKNVFEREDCHLPNVEEDIKEEISKDIQDDFDTPTIKVSEPFEPIKIPKFLKEVRVSLPKLSESEISTYIQRITKSKSMNSHHQFLQIMKLQTHEMSSVMLVRKCLKKCSKYCRPISIKHYGPCVLSAVLNGQHPG